MGTELHYHIQFSVHVRRACGDRPEVSAVVPRWQVYDCRKSDSIAESIMIVAHFSLVLFQTTVQISTSLERVKVSTHCDSVAANAQVASGSVFAMAVYLLHAALGN